MSGRIRRVSGSRDEGKMNMNVSIAVVMFALLLSSCARMYPPEVARSSYVGNEPEYVIHQRPVDDVKNALTNVSKLAAELCGNNLVPALLESRAVRTDRVSKMPDGSYGYASRPYVEFIYRCVTPQKIEANPS